MRERVEMIFGIGITDVEHIEDSGAFNLETAVEVQAICAKSFVTRVELRRRGEVIVAPKVGVTRRGQRNEPKNA